MKANKIFNFHIWIWIPILWVIVINCGEPGRTTMEPLGDRKNVLALLNIIEQDKQTKQSNNSGIESFLEDAPSGIKGDWTNNTPLGARCITNGNQAVCGTCNISTNVNLTRSGNIVSMDDVDWYCFNHASGTDPTYFTLTTERNDDFFQPHPTDTYISLYDSFPGTLSMNFPCTTFLCNEPGSGAFLTRDDEGGATPQDPVRTYSKIVRNLSNNTGVYYFRVGITTDRPGSYRIRLQRTQ